MKKDSSIFVAGHNGMVGSAIVSLLQKEGYKNILVEDKKNLNLLNQHAVNNYIANNDIDYIVIAAARVGGIHANNTMPASFIYENLMIQANIIHAAHNSGIKNLLFLGSSCIYPRDTMQPMNESALLSGKLESTNEPYAIAKIAGIKLCESYNRQYGHDYRSVMPTNLYGPKDNFNLDTSHVIPALIRKFSEAIESNADKVEVWGTGVPKREFLHVDDMAEACLHIMTMKKDLYQNSTQDMQGHINIGYGSDFSIKELANKLAIISGFKGDIIWDTSKPDGTPKKLMDNTLISNLGWEPKISLSDGLSQTYHWFLKNKESYKS